MNPRAVRAVAVAVALAALVALLFLVVFPWVDRNFLADPVLGIVIAAVPLGSRS